MRRAAEQSEVRFGLTRIPYGIRRSDRRRTVAVAVEPPGRVVLTAPADTPVGRLDEVVRAKAKWIVGRLRLVRPEEPAPAPREFVSGESFLYLGRQYRLSVEAGGRESAVKLEHGRFRVSVHRKLRGSERAETVRAALIGWYRARAAVRLPERVALWAPKIGVEVPRVLVRDQQKRWGSCSRGVVRFNWRIVQAPMRLVDYVVVHELVHLKHDHHGREFWAEVGRVMGDYELRRAGLRELGAWVVF